MSERLYELIAEACHAPSGDNTQPWRFVVDHEHEQFTVQLDSDRDLSPMNSGGRMARIALGATLESIQSFADRAGWKLSLEATETAFAWTARLDPLDVHRHAFQKKTKGVNRHCNRKLYDGRPLPNEVMSELRQLFADDRNVRLLITEDRSGLDKLAKLVGKGDRELFVAKPFRSAFVDNIRFDRPGHESVEEGLSLGSLEISRWEASFLRLLKNWPSQLLASLGIGKLFDMHAQKLVSSSSAVVTFVTRSSDDVGDIQVGRAVQKAWSKLAELGIACQPMMSLAVLDNALSKGSPELREYLRRRKVSDLLAKSEQSFGASAGERLAWIMRIGYADQVTARTGRRPLAKVLSVMPSSASAQLQSSREPTK